MSRIGGAARPSRGRPWARLLCGLTATAALSLATVSCGSSGTDSTPAAPPTSTVTPAPIPPRSEVPVVPPERRDAAFANALTSKNLQVGDPEARTQVAQTVCGALDAGMSLPDLTTQLQEVLGGPTLENTGFIIGASTAIYCPNNVEKLQQN